MVQENGEGRAAAVLFIGFDAAWMDNARAPGAMCAASFDGRRFPHFEPPQLVGFAKALEFIRSVHRDDRPTLLAIDQPTIVPNAKGMRPVDKVAASVVSWIGGGVQPANRAKIGMFSDNAPIWRFLQCLEAAENPELSRAAKTGLFLMEVFPALALPSIADRFCGKGLGPRYNPGRRKTFRIEDWRAVVEAMTLEADRLGVACVAKWLASLEHVEHPRKADQDRLDALICLLIAIRWRLKGREESVMVGDLERGYMVSPISPQVRSRLERAAKIKTVKIDGETFSD